MTRQCFGCREVKPLEDFARSRTCGRIGMCESCRSTRRKAVRADRMALRGKLIHTATDRTCCVCLLLRPISQFGANAQKSSGYQSYCNRCRSDEQRERQYGITRLRYDEMVIAQTGRCGSCSDPADLVVDHDHQTGFVRGLLCHNCNVAIGSLRDDPARIMAAAAYLITHESTIEAV